MEKLQWTTTHNTADNTMTHVFEHGRIMVFVDWNAGKIYTQKDGDLLDCIEAADVTLDEYNEMLVNLAKEDLRLSKFSAG
jgi:hypothetical protein